MDICYAHIVSVVMFANTYSLTHPMLYPLCAIFSFVSYRTHLRYIANFTKPCTYNSNDLDTSAIRFLYISSLFHFAITVIGYGSLQALICFCILAFIIFCKYSIVEKIIKLLRKKHGPCCFSKYFETHTCTKPLTSILTK